MWLKTLKDKILGRALNPMDQNIFHKMSLVAFFAWVGLGSDGLSSACYGPEEAYLALQGHVYLSIFVALATALTVFVISASYCQIIEVFPSGGGGYVVATKLLSRNLGMVSGCALLIDYLLTVTISIASGTDALFSFLPLEWHAYKLQFAVAGVILLTFMNLRGAKESVLPLVPVFLIFIATHVIAILYAVIANLTHFPQIISATHADIKASYDQVGLLGIMFLILRAYSLGAGTFTGIEAVSNGLPGLREPRTETGKRTMNYMAVSLAFTVFGLMLSYLIYDVHSQPGKTLNAVVFQSIAEGHGSWGHAFVLISLIVEALILFVAAQTGFLGGPRVLANMAIDRWFPTRFASLSDRLVTQNGILLMGGAAIVMMSLTRASVKFLVVLYSINVFITFSLSQLGMVVYWIRNRAQFRDWIKKLFVNGVSLLLTTFILVSVVILKFNEGGWITLLVTASLVILAGLIRKHYRNTATLLRRLDTLVDTVKTADHTVAGAKATIPEPQYDRHAKTAVVMVNGFNGLGLHTLFNVIRFFGREFRNFIFVEIGVVDAGNFKGKDEVLRLQQQAAADVQNYVDFMRKQGYFAEGMTFTGIDVMDVIERIGPQLSERFPGAVFFGGQLVFTKETVWTKMLHNYTVFAMQRSFYNQGIPFVVMPIRV